MSNLTILITGSGIAGSVFAFWLLRAYPSANIAIVERDDSLRLTGASVDIRSSAVDIIKWMGAEQEIRDHTTTEEGIEFVKADGKAFASSHPRTGQMFRALLLNSKYSAARLRKFSSIQSWSG